MKWIFSRIFFLSAWMLASCSNIPQPLSPSDAAVNPTAERNMINLNSKQSQPIIWEDAR